MLTSVPVAINNAARQVTLRHPQAFSCVVSRKRVKRVELKPGAGEADTMGGSPTMGGMGVLRSEDEAEIEYVELGSAKMVFAGPGQMPNRDIIERDNGTLPMTQTEVTLECVIDPGKPGHFVADSGDLVAVDMGMGVITAFEVDKPSSSVNIAPYTRRYILNPRDDLRYVDGFDN